MGFRGLILMLAWGTFPAMSAGQFPLYPGPYGAGYGGSYFGGGIGYSRGKVRVGIGFGAIGPYSYAPVVAPGWRSYSSLTVVSLYTPPPPPPPTVVVVQPSPTIVMRLGPRERNPDRPPPPPVPEVRPPAPPPPPPRRPGVDLERFLDPVPEAPAVEHARLIKEGKQAFAEGAYGLASQRFRAATRLRPGEPLPYFLLGQALLAGGKYHDASSAITAGLARDAKWPESRFQPRELYGDAPRELDDQLRQLDEARKRHPRDAVLLFLRGYQHWFAGERKEAGALFRQALPRFGDKAAIERFLKD